jgi:guanine deaminase
LQNTTFPTEAKFKDAQFAKQVYSSVVYRTLNLGTTTACYYATLHSESSSILADIALDKGQRAFIGKCNMDRESPDWYREQDAASSVRDTRQVIKYITSLNSKLVQPILTPRFAISCTDQLLTELGNLANEDEHRDLAIQTHISENLDEVAYVRQLFPDLPDYASVYDHFHLLRHNTVLAHGVHLTNAELALIKKRDAGISHCPTSNFNLRSGVAPVDRWVKQGLKVGLGTDVSGGFSLGMLSAVRDASIASKVVSFTDSNSTFLSIPTLVYLATLGGASVCNLSRRIGSLEPGKAFDALIVSIRHDAGNPALWGQGAPGYQAQGAADRKTLQQNLEKFLFCGDDRNIKSVYVAGKLVGGHEHFGGNYRSCAN